MSIVAESTSPLSFSFPDDPELIYDVPLAELLTKCQSIAHRFHRQHGCREPVEEYVSAAHMTLTLCMASFAPAIAPPGGFRAYVLFQVAMACRHVRRATAGAGNMARHIKGREMKPKYAVESWDHDHLYALCTVQARQETTVYLHEVLGELARHGTAGQMLLATVEGETRETIAAQHRCTQANIKSHTVRLRQKLRAWSTAVSSTPDAQECPS